MSDNIDFRLNILGRYRQGSPRERLNLWFAHPGLRSGFDLVDRDRDEGRRITHHLCLDRMHPTEGAGLRPEWARTWSGLSRAGFLQARPGSPDTAASGGPRRGG